MKRYEAPGSASTVLLEPVCDMLLSPKVIVYDTESDGVGASCGLEQTREYHFYNVTKQDHTLLQGTRIR